MTADHLPPAYARAVALVVAVAALVALASSDAVHQAVLQVLEAAKGIMVAHPVAGPTLFVVLAAASAMLAFFSSAVLVPAAVYAWGPAATAALLWLGWILGGLSAYALAWWAGRGALRWIAPGRSFTRYEERFRERVSFGSVLLFQLALPSEIPGYVLGLARYPLAKYLAALAIVEVPYAVGTMLIGASFVSRDIGMLLGVGTAAAVGVVVVARALKSRLA
jgi:uncharacterized membrane protein YdjX (TVP38/TMEM64 family)